jgi:hypothetical protein
MISCIETDIFGLAIKINSDNFGRKVNLAEFLNFVFLSKIEDENLKLWVEVASNTHSTIFINSN